MWQNIKNIYHLFQAIGALLLYRFPSRKMIIIGVTGTDGKTTTASLIYHGLATADHKTALISSVSAIINGKSFDTGFHVTTPSSFAIQRYLQKAKKEGVKFVVLEVTSHGLHQNRVYGIPFEIGVVTNITKEHLDYHKTYERYVAAKAILLKHSKIAVVNKDDGSYHHLKKYLRHKKTITYGMKKDSVLNPHLFQFKTKLLGKFNQYNTMAAIAVLRQLHVPDDVIRKGIASFTPPAGRQEVLYNKDFCVINDFAHTPNSFASILPEVKKNTKGRIIHIFGCAGQRDHVKRPEMGRISGEFADIIILTAEDPRDEPVEKINEEIKKGISNFKFQISNVQDHINLDKSKKYLFEISDRKEAIAFAISIAEKGDTVILTGKGHEKSMNYGRGEEPWSEHEAVKEALQKVSSIK